ncbi:hypothetical protein GO495_13365 [Chitinophaga oryziterrae]|uniref:DUF922 domain-containing protein n=1 Tax=Chitinophaga oryziterrae TaxID=1031224 RepID=A0A6N8J8L5_9BACT|nr:hypothetical protein [Chitinophaga oryziterrae]MVT41577.1 hypothetical protein [Chitinophaga oryziterrae]
MKQFLYAFAVICLYSCTPKLNPGITTNRPPLADSAFVLVLDEGDRFHFRDEIGTINSVDNGACTYDEAIDKLKQIARSKGANLVKITEYKKPDYKNNCDRITAKIYKVDNVKSYETKFEWSSTRKLTWDDYKGTPKPGQDTNVAATTSCRLGLRMEPGPNVVITNEFICYQSSVRPTQRKPALLVHEQLHFDLCEVYARKLRKELAAAHLTVQNATAVSGNAFLKMHTLYKERQDLYDEETNHGLDPEPQARWQHDIAAELAAFTAYAR